MLSSALLFAAGRRAFAVQPQSGYRLREYPFKLGIASGSPYHDSVVIWTRIIVADEPASILVHWEVAEEENFCRIVRQGITLAVPVLGYSVHVEVDGLAPDRWYWYRFRVGNAQSDIGRTRTFPAPNTKAAERLRFAYASCQRWESGYFSAYRHMARESVDFVIFLGDYIYLSRAGRNAIRTHNLSVPETLSDYRQRYELYKGDEDLQRMHALCPWLVTWDDGEVENSYAGMESVIGGVDFGARRMAAYQAYYEHMPLRTSVLLHGIGGIGRPDGVRVYNRYQFGKLANIYMLDNRQYRDLPLCSDSWRNDGKLRNCAKRDSADRTYLGWAQERWLDEELRLSAESEVAWDVIGTQTVFTRRMNQASENGVVSSGTWSGYRSAQSRMLDSLVRNKVRNPVFVGGDIHQNRVANIHQNLDDPGSTVIGSEFCGTSITTASKIPQAQLDRAAISNPHWIFANSEQRGYGVVEITPKQCEVTLRAVHDVRDKDSGIETLAKFVVEDGKPGIRRLS